MYNNEDLSTDGVNERMGIGKLRTQRDLHLCGVMYNRTLKDEYVDNRELPNRPFDKIVLKVPDVLLTKSFSTPMFKGSNLWNTLPREIQMSPTYKEFKYRYKNLVCNRLP